MGHLSGGDDLSGNAPHHFNGCGEPDTFSTRLADPDGGCDADQLAFSVDEGATARTVRDWGIGLQHAEQRGGVAGIDLTVERRDDTNRQRGSALEPKGVAYRDGTIANLERHCRSQFDGHKAGSPYLEDGEVCQLV